MGYFTIIFLLLVTLPISGSGRAFPPGADVPNHAAATASQGPSPPAGFDFLPVPIRSPAPVAEDKPLKIASDSLAVAKDSLATSRTSLGVAIATVVVSIVALVMKHVAQKKENESLRDKLAELRAEHGADIAELKAQMLTLLPQHQ